MCRITAGHRTFSDQFCYLTGQFYTCAVMMSAHYIIKALAMWTERLFLACAIFPLLFPLHPITHTLATEDLRLSLHLFQTHSPVPTKSSTLGLMTHQLPALMLMAVTKATLRCSVHTLGAGLRKNGSMNISPG